MMYARLQQLFAWIFGEITPVSQLAAHLQQGEMYQHLK